MIFEAVTEIIAMIGDRPISSAGCGERSQQFEYVMSPEEYPISEIPMGSWGLIALSLNDVGPMTYRRHLVNAADRALIPAVNHGGALRTIEDLKDLPADWAGANTKVPAASTRSAAKALILSLPAFIPTPHVAPSADGEIGFSWAIGTKRIESILAPDNQLVWFWTEGTEVFAGDEVAFAGFFPDELVKLLDGRDA